MDLLRVALTFDAEHPSRRRCPPGIADKIVAELDRLAVRATFFIQGRWATAYPELALKIARAGHRIGNHSHFHAPVPALSDDGLRRDLETAEAAIRRISGVDPRPWFRCPFGAGHDDARLLAALATLGYRNVHWDIDGKDWAEDQTAGAVESTIVDGVLAHGDGAVVLMHTWPEPALTALPSIITRLRAGGASLVTVDAVIEPTETLIRGRWASSLGPRAAP